MLSYLLSFCVLAYAACLSLCYDTATCPPANIPLHTSAHKHLMVLTHAISCTQCMQPWVCNELMCTCPLVSTHTLVHLGQKSLALQDYTYLAHLRYKLILILNQLQCDSVGLWAVHEGSLAVDHRAFMACNLLSLHPAGVWPVRLLSRAFTQWSFKSRDLFSKQN